MNSQTVFYDSSKTNGTSSPVLAGGQMPFTFLYRDAKKTLKATEVNEAHKLVLDTLAAKVKELRFR